MNVRHRVCSKAFTLIEVLVVIAIVALLVSILLPAIRKARVEAWKAVSMSNVRQICIAGATCQSDNKGTLLLQSHPSQMVSGLGIGTHDEDERKNWPGRRWRTWSAFGKYCDQSWSEANSGMLRWRGAYDYWANRRPLNLYLHPDSIRNPLLPGQQMISTSVRKSLQIKVCKDPSDTVGHQQTLYLFQKDPAQENKSPALSCYDDVGTSYQWTEIWARQLDNALWGNGIPEISDNSFFKIGQNLLRDASFPAEMIWVNDESSKLMMASFDSKRRIKNGYGDINRGVVGYLDGHVRYVPITPIGPNRAPEWITNPMSVSGFRNNYYRAAFEKLALPKNIDIYNRSY